MTCPHCQRRLLSHASANCNWCGAEITDSDYQAKAQVEREIYFAQQALHDAQSLARIDNINVNAYDPCLNSFTSAPLPSQYRRGTSVRPLTYNNHPQPVRSEGQSTDIRPAANTSESDSQQTVEPERQESEQRGRFQHLEL